jgi:hypothetical protein
VQNFSKGWPYEKCSYRPIDFHREFMTGRWAHHLESISATKSKVSEALNNYTENALKDIPPSPHQRKKAHVL